MDPRAPAIHVLAINDDLAILGVYADLLAEEGYRVTTERMPYVDPADVIAIGPDVIVLDLLVRHEERGAGFLAMLKVDPATRDVPVVVCSGDSGPLKEIAEPLGTWDCGVVEKPFDIDDVLAVVRACLDRRLARRDRVAVAEMAAD